jgi:hypothetical protein
MMDELMTELKTRMAPDDTWRRTVKALDRALGPFHLHGHHLGCC